MNDLLRMEAIAVPLSFLVLVWVFGGAIASMLPLVVGLMAAGIWPISGADPGEHVHGQDGIPGAGETFLPPLPD
jgi:hypothetical protein